MTKKEWEERSRIWSEALPGFLSPAEVGFSKTLIGQYTLRSPDIEEILQSVPSTLERAQKLAESFVLDERCAEIMELRKKLRKTEGKEKPATEMADSYDWFGVYSEALSWLKSSDGQARFMREKSDIFSKIEPVITREILFREILPNADEASKLGKS